VKDLVAREAEEEQRHVEELKRRAEESAGLRKGH